MGVGVGGRGKVRGVFGGPLLVRVGRHAFGWLVGLGFCWMGLGGVCGWMDGSILSSLLDFLFLRYFSVSLSEL